MSENGCPRCGQKVATCAPCAQLEINKLVIAWGLVTFLMGLAVFVLAVRFQDASLELEQLKHVKPCIEAKP